MAERIFMVTSETNEKTVTSPNLINEGAILEQTISGQEKEPPDGYQWLLTGIFLPIALSVHAVAPSEAAAKETQVTAQIQLMIRRRSVPVWMQSPMLTLFLVEIAGGTEPRYNSGSYVAGESFTTPIPVARGEQISVTARGTTGVHTAAGAPMTNFRQIFSIGYTPGTIRYELAPQISGELAAGSTS